MVARLLTVSLGVGLLLVSSGCSQKPRDQIPTEIQPPPAEPPVRVGGPPPAAAGGTQPEDPAAAKKPAVAQ